MCVCIFCGCIYFNRTIDLMSKVFANNPGNRSSIPAQAIPKTQKMVLDASLLKLSSMR